MRVNSHPIIIHQLDKKYLDNNKNEEDPKIKKRIEEIYNSIYDDNFYLILTISKVAFLNRIELKGKEIIEIIFNHNNNYINILKKIKLEINSRYNEDYAIINKTYNNIKNRIGNYNYLTNFRKHCEKTEEFAYHTCINNKIEKIYEIRDNQNEIQYLLCPDCKFCFLPNCIKMVCHNCNKEYFSCVIPQNQDKNILLATWDKYHCGSMKNQTMKCIKCRKNLYLNLITNNLICLNKSCNFSSKPSSILWKCSKCGKDFRSKPKIFNPTELEIIQKSINLTLLIKKKAYPKELPCCHRNPEKMTFYHKEECKGILYMGFLLDREIIVCNSCHAMNFEEKFTWICPKCNIKFHLHQLTSIKPFKAKKYIINKDNILLTKRNNKSNINIRNSKNEESQENNIKNMKNDKYLNDDYLSIKSANNSLLYKNYKNSQNLEKKNNNINIGKRIYSDNDRSYSNDGYSRQYKRIDSTSIDEHEKFKKDEIIDNNSQYISLGRERLDLNKNQKKRRHYRTLLDILEKKNKKDSIIQSGRPFTNSEFSFNDNNSNNYMDVSNFGINKKECILTYNKTSRNNAKNISDRGDSKWHIITEMNENNINEDDNFIYKKKINIPSYIKSHNNDKNCRLNDYKSQVSLLKDRQKDRNTFNININSNFNKFEEDKNIPAFNSKNNSMSTNSYFIGNDSVSRKSINSSYKINQNLQHLRINNNSAINMIENRIFRYNQRNDKKNDLIMNNTNISNIPNLNNELKNIKRNNNILTEEYNRSRIKVSEYSRKNKNSNQNEDNTKYKNNNINNEENNKKIQTNNYLIYQDTKNYFVKFTLRQSSLDNNQTFDHKSNNKEKNKIKSNENPTKVSRIYQNKIIQKNSDKEINCNNDKNIRNIKSNYSYSGKGFENKKEGLEEKKYIMKIKKSNEKYSMNNIIASPEKIKDIQKSCIIPDFEENDYKYLRPIGEGSYGMIFLVKNIKENKEYALKKIICKNIKEILKHKNQLELIYSMRHQNIMKIYNLKIKYLDLTTYSLYIIMERAIGDWSLDIRKRILNKKFYKEFEIINILKQVVSALLYLEERKIAHRDVKPQNILIFPGKIYKVADLGEAKNIDNISREMTLRGSELYMSPLIYQKHKINKKDLIHNAFKSDVFSLGYSTLYAICLNLKVLEDIREVEDMKKVVNSIDKYFNKSLFSDKLYRLIINMIETDENKRYGFKEINRELKNW